MRPSNFFETRLRREAQTEGAPGGDPAGDPPAAPDLSWVPEQFVKDGQPDLDGFKAHYTSLSEFKTQADAAKAAVPESPDAYEFAFNKAAVEGLDLPEDFAFEIKADDPVLAEFRGTMHELGVPKEGAAKVFDLLTKYEGSKFAEALAHRKAEMTTLGPNHQARIGEVKRLLESRLPENLAKGLMDATYTAAGVQALEKLLASTGQQPPAAAAPGSADADAHLRAYYASPKR